MSRPGRTTLVLGIFVACCALSCFAQEAAGGKSAGKSPPPSKVAESDPKAWKVFSSKAGGFSVTLPAKFKQRASASTKKWPSGF